MIIVPGVSYSLRDRSAEVLVISSCPIHRVRGKDKIVEPGWLVQEKKTGRKMVVTSKSIATIASGFYLC